MEEIYRLAVETGATSRGSLGNKAFDRLGMEVTADQLGTALAWVRAARAACGGPEPARAAHSSYFWFFFIELGRVVPRQINTRGFG